MLLDRSRDLLSKSKLGPHFKLTVLYNRSTALEIHKNCPSPDAVGPLARGHLSMRPVYQPQRHDTEG